MIKYHMAPTAFSRLARFRDLRVRLGDGGPGSRARNTLSAADVDALRRSLHDCLSARGGELSAWERAADLATTYERLGDDGRHAFLSLVAAELGSPLEAAVEAAWRIVRASDPSDRADAVRTARQAMEPQWMRLLTQFNDLLGGTEFLVGLRADVRRFAQEDSALAPLERDLRHLLASWFGVGQLELRRITWDSPASLLERLAELEAVHKVAGWEDLKNRLDADRRYFAFFHPRMPAEPLVFLEVALVTELAAAIEPLLDPDAPLVAPAEAKTAIFYSISNTQPGLSGISLGGFLIKQVVDALRSEAPSLRTFATLSPIPGFRDWLERMVGHEQLPEPERAHIVALLRRARPERADELEPHRSFLLQLCAHYLLVARRADGRVMDGVANFHLANGARIERLNWYADPSAEGWTKSLGLMVNYLYELDAIEANHEQYISVGEVSAAAAVTRLARKWRPNPVDFS
jgi:malonyl-CoA decarboxylase